MDRILCGRMAVLSGWLCVAACGSDDPTGMVNPGQLPPEALQDMAGYDLPDYNVGVTPNGNVGDAAADDGGGGGNTNPEDVESLDQVNDEVVTADVSTPDINAPDIVNETVQCDGPDRTFPKFSRDCSSNTDCSVVFHTVDCCGTLVAWGIRSDMVDSFQTAEETCVAQMPLCDCLPSQTVADDGNHVATSNDAFVTCDRGQCTTHSASPPPTDGTALEEWLKKGYYSGWPSEPAAHASAGPHFGQVRVFQNQRLYDAAKQGNQSWPQGSTSIKELFGNGSTPVGWSVSVKIQENPPAGDGFYWYELYQGQKYADGPSVPLCVNCHASGTDYVITKIP